MISAEKHLLYTHRGLSLSPNILANDRGKCSVTTRSEVDLKLRVNHWGFLINSNHRVQNILVSYFNIYEIKILPKIDSKSY